MLVAQKKNIRNISTQKVLLWIAIGSIVMLFAGLTSAYIVREAEGNWKHFEVPFYFYVSTGIILLSSICINMALIKTKKDQNLQATLFLGLTLLLGIGFVVSQYLGWAHLVSEGVYFVDPKTPSGSFMYVLTGLHLVHVLGGLIALVVTLTRSGNHRYSSSNSLGVELCATYWHFLGGLWVYLFFFLLLVR